MWQNINNIDISQQCRTTEIREAAQHSDECWHEEHGEVVVSAGEELELY